MPTAWEESTKQGLPAAMSGPPHAKASAALCTRSHQTSFEAYSYAAECPRNSSSASTMEADSFSSSDREYSNGESLGRVIGRARDWLLALA